MKKETKRGVVISIISVLLGLALGNSITITIMRWCGITSEWWFYIIFAPLFAGVITYKMYSAITLMMLEKMRKIKYK